VCVCVSYPTRSQMNINEPEEPSVRRDKATDKSSQGNAPRDRSSLYAHTHTHAACHTGKRLGANERSMLVFFSVDVCVCGGLTQGCVHDGMCICLE